MEYISVGKIMETFALKGEVKIASNFKLKEKVFVAGNNLYVGNNKECLVISKIRFYKDRVYVLFEGFNHIDEAEKYLKEIVYIKKEEISLDGDYLDEDIIGFNIIDKSKNIGILKKINYVGNNSLFEISSNNKTFYIPNNKEFIKKIDFGKKEIIVETIKGMIE
ncbi:MAG TPA: ribosome maturation factor RimM [Bacilli bacterium]|nr:ribosome maturation factor RimM [Bacilli bacterium]